MSNNDLRHFDWIGLGYYGFGCYAEPGDLRSRVVDLGAESSEFQFADERYAYPTAYLRPNLRNERDAKYIEADSISEYQHKLSEKSTASVSVALFSMEVQQRFEQEIESREERYYASYEDMMLTYIIRVDNLADFRQALSSKFMEKCDGTPEEIVANFGTHVVVEVECGGVATWHVSSEKSNFSSKEDFSLAVDAAYGAFKAGGEISTSDTHKEIQSSLEKSFRVKGGDPSLVIEAQSGGYLIEEWMKSVRNPDDGLVLSFKLDPIENYVPQDKRAALQDYVLQRGKELAIEQPSIVKKWKESLDKKVSMESSNFPNHFMRHINFQLRIDRYDGFETTKLDSTFILRHGNARGENIDEAEKCFSFESVNFPGYYMRHYNFKCGIAEKTADQNLNSSFIPREALNGREGYFSLESVNFPGYFVRHYDFWVGIAPFEDNDEYKNNASWELAKPLKK